MRAVLDNQETTISPFQ